MKDEGWRRSLLIPHPLIRRGAVPHLLCLRLVALLDHLAPAVATAALADAMCTHQLLALWADHQHRRIQALVLSPVAAAVARNFCLRYGTHEYILISFLYSFRRFLSIAKRSSLSS